MSQSVLEIALKELLYNLIFKKFSPTTVFTLAFTGNLVKNHNWIPTKTERNFSA